MCGPPPTLSSNANPVADVPSARCALLEAVLSGERSDEVLVAKHRSGPTGMDRLAFLDHYTRFANMAKDI